MKIVGIKQSIITSGKNEGKTAFTYYMQQPFSDYDIENSVCQGTSVTSEFSYKDFGVAVGDEVTCIYEKGFMDKAMLVNIVPFTPASKTK